MDILGNLNLKSNELQDGKFQQLAEFPSQPKVGTWAFIEKQLYVCVEVEEKPVWIPLTPKRDTFLFRPPVAAKEWTITHKLDTDKVMVQCFDNQDRVMVPDSVEILDNMNVVVKFPEDVLGTAIVMFGYTEGADVDGKFKEHGRTLPIGSIIRMAKSDSIPEEFLPLAGQTITREFFPELVTYLADSDTDSVVLDDARGIFVRNLDMGKGVDTDRIDGSLQDSEFTAHNHAASIHNKDLGTKTSNAAGNHKHSSGANFYPYSTSQFTYPYGKHVGSGKSGGWGKIYGNAPNVPYTSDSGNHAHSVAIGSHNHGITVNDAGGSENRPQNIAYVLVIKAK